VAQSSIISEASALALLREQHPSSKCSRKRTKEPLKMRILTCLPFEVDEANPDYINGKHQGLQKLKSDLEAIFDKYANLHESQSDIIDIRTNTVVEDRGHLRRRARQMDRYTLVDRVLVRSWEDSSDGEREDAKDSEDELTLPPLVTSKTTRLPEQGRSERGAEAVEVGRQSSSRDGPCLKRKHDASTPPTDEWNGRSESGNSSFESRAGQKAFPKREDGGRTGKRVRLNKDNMKESSGRRS
jgi:hypothetical protein